MRIYIIIQHTSLTYHTHIHTQTHNMDKSIHKYLCTIIQVHELESRVLCYPIVSRPFAIHTMGWSSHLPLQSTMMTNPLSSGNNIHRWSHACHVPTLRTSITHQHMGCSTFRPTQHTPQAGPYHCQTWVNCTIHICEVTLRTIMHMVLYMIILVVWSYLDNSKNNSKDNS